MDLFNNQYSSNGYSNWNQPQQNFPMFDQNPTFAGIYSVNGEQAAQTFPVARNTKVLLMDTQNDVFYVKTTDTNGAISSFRTFDYTERQDVPAQTTSSTIDTQQPAETKAHESLEYVTKEDLDNRINRLMDFIEEKVTLPQSKEGKK